jgi:hypothetical protein
MSKSFAAMFGVLIGYIDGAGLGAVSIDLFSGYGADKDVQIAMIAAFVTGPLGALLGLLAALARQYEPAADPELRPTGARS